MNYYQEFDYSMEPGLDALGAVAGTMFGFVLVFYLLTIGFSVLSYVLQSLGMYTIAKRRGIRNPWLSWVPVGNMWILGSISDQYQYVAKGRVRNKRKVLLGLMLAIILVITLIWGSLFAVIFSEITAMDANEVLLGASVGGMLIAYLALMVITVTAAVFQYMALYDLFASCEPSNGTLYLVLTIFLGVVLPFFVFACRKKDLGMPPRRTQEAEIPMAVPVVEAYAEAPCDEEVSPEEACVMGMEIEENKENPPVEE